MLRIIAKSMSLLTLSFGLVVSVNAETALYSNDVYSSQNAATELVKKPRASTHNSLESLSNIKRAYQSSEVNSSLEPNEIEDNTLALSKLPATLIAAR